MKYKEIHFDNIDSTNIYLKNHYQELDNFCIVSSDFQFLGRGRNDHKWLSNKGDNLLFSLLIKNKDIIKNGPIISLISAVSLNQLLEKKDFKDSKIKWPNDIFIGNKKVAGILLESKLPEYIIIGIGLNVNQKRFIGKYNNTPTSLYLEKRSKIDISLFKKELYELLINNLLKLSNRKEFYFNYFNNHNYLLSKRINYIMNNEEKSGQVIGIDKDFNLIIKNKKEIIHLNSGEVNIMID